jgi:[FeFe] hydrogenase H-cluster maturation GTPase HydF
MNTTPQGERVRIVLAGRCNAGKSSLINALAGQPVAIVSGERGTTTDPVRKAMELLPIGPVLLCDTAGLDDSSALGPARLEKTRAELRQANLVLLVCDKQNQNEKCKIENVKLTDAERAVLDEAAAHNIPAIVVLNKSDLGGKDAVAKDAIASGFAPSAPAEGRSSLSGRPLHVSALTGVGIPELKAAIIAAIPHEKRERRIVADLVAPGSVVVLVVPIDSAAPKGRLILPQQQTIRDLLDAGCIPVVVRDTELAAALAELKVPPALVVTDSQAFGKVAAIVPPSVPLTSFSILFARYKGDIDALVEGARAVAALKDGDRILVAEGCTHHRQDDDIGTVKIPRLLRQKTGKELVFEHCSGIGYPPDLADYALVIHCGGCMLNRREMLERISAARAAGVPIVNYGVLLAALNGILPRALAPLAEGA